MTRGSDQVVPTTYGSTGKYFTTGYVVFDWYSTYTITSATIKLRVCYVGTAKPDASPSITHVVLSLGTEVGW